MQSLHAVASVPVGSYSTIEIMHSHCCVHCGGVAWNRCAFYLSTWYKIASTQCLTLHHNKSIFMYKARKIVCPFYMCLCGKWIAVVRHTSVGGYSWLVELCSEKPQIETMHRYTYMPTWSRHLTFLSFLYVCSSGGGPLASVYEVVFIGTSWLLPSWCGNWD